MNEANTLYTLAYYFMGENMLNTPFTVMGFSSVGMKSNKIIASNKILAE